MRPVLVRPLLLPFPIEPRHSARVGVAMPDASASRVNHASYASPVSRRTMLRIAALASSVVGRSQSCAPPPGARPPGCNTHVNTAWCVSTSISRRVRDRVEWSGGASCSRSPGTAGCSASAAATRALRVQALKMQQQAEIAPRRQTRPPEAVGIALRALCLDEGVEARVVEDATHRTDARRSSADVGHTCLSVTHRHTLEYKNGGEFWLMLIGQLILRTTFTTGC